MLVFRPFCITHSFVVAGEKMLRAAQEEREPGLVMCILCRVSRRTVEVLWPALHRVSIHEVGAVLVGGRATPTMNSCTGNRDKATRGKCSQFLELLGSVAVAVPANYTRYMNQPCIYMGKVGETVKDGWECHPRTEDRAGWSTHRDVPSPVHSWEIQLC
jgi:hypothetical protein